MQKRPEELPALSQDSEDLYGPAVIDAAVCWELAEMEGQHGPPPARAGGSRCGLVRSSTTTDASPSSHEQQGLLNTLPFRRIASQPEGTSATRAVEARRVKFQRLDRTKKLDKYVPVMKNMCVAHLLEKGVLELEHFPAPCSDLDAHGDVYQVFRR